MGKKEKVKEELVKLIKKKNETYSPLALYFLIDNNIVSEKEEINKLFNIIINETKLEKEIKNLIIYKKALFNSNFVTENELIMILKPLINSESIWSSHALYLIAEFFHSKDETSKAKEFYSKIIIIKNGNPNIVEMAQRRLNRELSE